MMRKYLIPKNIEKDAAIYMEDVLSELKDRGVLEEVDSAALTMLARNYSMFIRASK
jgi:phage terminase small subunit